MLLPKEYQQVFKSGSKQTSAFFALIVCANNKPHARLGLAIAKRHVPLAVDRNRIRRVIRESFRQSQVSLLGIDIVVLARREIHSFNTMNLHKDLSQQWLKLVGFLKK